MYKIKFNSLYASVMDFVLDEKIEQVFDSLEKEIRYYHNLVDDYNELLFNLNNIKNALDSNNELMTDIDESLLTLNTIFEKYKEKSPIIRSYLHELDNFEAKVLFAERLYKYEQMFLSDPLIKVDVDEIQEVVNFAKEYVKNRTSFYYFSNNPFELYDDLGIPVPIRYSFDNPEQFLTSVYNYSYGLFQRHLQENEDTLNDMELLETSIKEKLFEYNVEYDESKRYPINSSIDVTPEEFHTAVMELEAKFKVMADAILEIGITRFTEHMRTFNFIYNKIAIFIDEYKENELFVIFTKNCEFDNKINQLGEFVSLIESGSINADVDYVITDTSLKEIVEEIDELSSIVKRKIRYTQKFHFTGEPTELEFEFYEIVLFLSSIKEYYYTLMTENIYQTSKLTIDDFGDDSVTDFRNDYKIMLTKYRMFIKQNVDYLNHFEFKTYQKNIIELQTRLKAVAAIFFSNALKTSPTTYIVTIEQHYFNVLNMLTQDLVDLSANRHEVVLEVTNKSKEKAYMRMKSVEELINKIDMMIVVSEDNTFFWLTEYINQFIKIKFTVFFDEMSVVYNKEDYIELLKIYDEFYTSNMVSFNLIHSMIKFSESTEELFKKIVELDDFYMIELTNDEASKDHPEQVAFLIDLFDDDTYKVVRNEIFGELDLMYEFIIATKPNDKSFLMNEKNLKKMFFDTQMMKINYYKWYHNILASFDIYNALDLASLERNELFQEKKSIIEGFEHKDKINMLIQARNMALSSLTKMITEYASDSNFDSSIEANIIQNIDTYNNMIKEEYTTFNDTITKLESVEDYVLIEDKMLSLQGQHTNQWVDMISVNTIDEPDKVSYRESEIFTGNIPFTVSLKAKMETTIDATGAEVESTFKWFLGEQVKEGEHITHTFYEEGEQTIRCEINYSSGETNSKYITFVLGGPQNSLTVKADTIDYAPLREYTDQPKFTYFDPETNYLVTIPLEIRGNGNILDMIDDGAIKVYDNNTVLIQEKIGLVIVGFSGEKFAGYPYNNDQIFYLGWDWPEQDEFLFDFYVSVPLAGTATIDIDTSKYTKFMARIPNDIPSVFEIDKASGFTSIGTDTKISIGDKLILRNHFERYAIIVVKDMNTLTEPEDGKYYYNIVFDYYVNISLDQFNRDSFTPKRTDMDIPKLVFKTSVRELFGSLIERLELINVAKGKLAAGVDAEEAAILNTDINAMEKINSEFYLFEELDKIKAKRHVMQLMLESYERRYMVDFDLSLDEIDEQINKFKIHIDDAKSFSEYISSIDAYDFKQNMVDLKVMVNLYREQQTLLEILISTYGYKNVNMDFYIGKVAEIKMFDTAGFIDTSLPYNEALVNLVTRLRELLFKVKLVINFPIMSEGQHILMSHMYRRLTQDLSSGEWRKEEDLDLFLLNKKLELMYGYETEKVEDDNPYTDFITELVHIEKDIFGKGLSEEDIKNISKYIQAVEAKTVDEYDDFFLIPFWLDYLEKNA